MNKSKQEIAQMYRKELQQNPTKEKALNIAERIVKLKYESGKSISTADRAEIISYIEDPLIDSKTGMRLVADSDNTKFLKLVAIIKNQIKGVK